ncbi:peptide ABC transporter substrate-binding protein [Helcococcus kunzii]
MKNSKKVLSLLLALVMVFLVACGGPTGGDKTTKESTGETDKNGGESNGKTEGESEVKEYTYAGTNSLKTLDYITTNKNPDNMWNANFVDGLLEHDRIGQLQPALAESYSVSEDGLKWTFKLKKGVKWVTNTEMEYAEVKADDFVTGLRHAAEFKSESSAVVSGIIKGYAEYLNSDFSDAEWEKVGVKALDDYTVEYTLEKPAPYFGDITTYTILYPVNRKFLESFDGAKLGSPEPTKTKFGSLSPDSILYNGGYILSSVDDKSSIVIVKNNQYWDAEHVYLEKVTEIFDDGKDPYSIKNGFENGTYVAMSMRPTWEDYNKVRKQYEQYVRPNLPNASTFGTIFNFNRKSFKYTKYAKDEALKENTRKALLNENFRKGLRAAYDRVPELRVDAPEALAREALKNVNNYIDAAAHSDGRDYLQLVTDAYNAATGEKLDLSDGQDPFYNKEKAAEYFAAAEKEGIKFPVHLDMLVLETNDRLVKKANSMKQSIKQGSDGKVIIELNLVPQDTIQAIAFQNNDPAAADYDINTFAGWGPDYNDPKSYADTWSATTGSNLTNAGLSGVDENGNVADKDIKEKIGLMEYEKLYREADKITDDLDKRYEAFAKSDAYFVEKALYIPVTMAARGEIISKAEPFVGIYSPVGVSQNKYKYQKIRKELVTAEEYNKAKEQWQKERVEARKNQAQ